MKDVLVVGGGPAGLAVGLACRREGLSVTVVDRRPGMPVDKACGEGLMPDGAAVLERLGVDVGGLGGAPFRGIRYVDGDTVAEGEFPGRPGLGVRRPRLHRALVEAAEAAGVEISWGTRVDGLDHRPGPLGGTYSVRLAGGGAAPRCRWLVGADGLLSRMRGWADLAAGGRRAEPPGEGGRFGVRRHFAVPPGEVPDKVEVWWGDGFEAYVTPVAADEVGVAILWSGSKAGFDELLAGLPRLADRLSGQPERSRDRGAGPLAQPVRGVTRGNLALVGDASGYVDAITGEGLSLAFRQAEALAIALAAGDPTRYAAAHRRIGRLPDRMTRLLLAVERHPRLRRRTIRALAADPTLFNRLLALHVGELEPRDFGLRGVARLARRLILAA